MSSNPFHNKYVHFYDLVKNYSVNNTKYTSHLKNPKVLMPTTSKPYIVLL